MNKQKTFYGTLKKSLFLLLIPIASNHIIAQDDESNNSNTEQNKIDAGNISGNFQVLTQFYQPDSLIGAKDVPEDVLMNGFLNLNYNRGNFSAGIRYEAYQNPLLGYPTGFKGQGIPYKYAKYSHEDIEVTAGNYYEQFGSGMIFRTYEDRNLGYDNAMEGFRVKYQPFAGVQLKGVIGKQRSYFTLGQGIVRGIDGEITINDLFKNLKEKKTKVLLGGSFVSKFQPDEDANLVLPENVGAYGGRLNIIRGGFNFMGEYVYKINDPSGDNGFIYKNGEGVLVQTTYSTKGFGLSLSAKRIDNMSFRSDRNAALTNLMINYHPALTRQHSYNLLATLYPYATQPNGEVAFQGELIYKIPKKSKLGGKYGWTILVNYSSANNIDTTGISGIDSTRQGYTSEYFSLGKVYFKDFNIELAKKFSKSFKAKLTYANIAYNKDVIQGKSGYGVIYADVVVAEMTYKFNSKNSLRTELQSLTTEQDQGDWATVLLEYSRSPHWFFAIMDQYNYGNHDPKKVLHYPTISMGYNNKATSFIITYGKQREGLFCVGGVCRAVPASNGVSLLITTSF